MPTTRARHEIQSGRPRRTLTWALMPLAARLLGRWLDPVEGAGRRTSLLGTAGVCAGYVVLFVIFGTVGFLQP